MAYNTRVHAAQAKHHTDKVSNKMTHTDILYEAIKIFNVL